MRPCGRVKNANNECTATLHTKFSYRIRIYNLPFVVSQNLTEIYETNTESETGWACCKQVFTIQTKKKTKPVFFSVQKKKKPCEYRSIFVLASRVIETALKGVSVQAAYMIDNPANNCK